MFLLEDWRLTVASKTMLSHLGIEPPPRKGLLPREVPQSWVVVRPGKQKRPERQN